MEIKLAKYSGFCFGVRRAVDLVETALEKKGGKIYSIGPFIHNPQVIGTLASRGLEVAENIGTISSGTIVVRCHGVEPSLIEKARKRGLDLVDTTCPYVMRSQKITKDLKNEGYFIIVVGEARHPEVKALIGIAEGEALVVYDGREIGTLGMNHRKIGVVAQTTQSRDKYLKIISQVVNRGFQEVRIFDTICDDTLRRQESTLEVARTVNGMLIVGGKTSANTRRLAEISRSVAPKVYHIETAEEIDPEWFTNVESVGVASGASTPEWIIEEVLEKLKKIKSNEVQTYGTKCP